MSSKLTKITSTQGQFNGEAFIQMDSEPAAHMCAAQRHHRNMMFGKKQRYIEVFQCSGEDMNMVLQGATFHSQAAAVAAAAANKPPLLSPGMLTPAQGTPQSALMSHVAPPISPLTLSIPVGTTAGQPSSAAIIAQQQAQQAQYIAQHNLYARQQAVAVQQQQQHHAHQQEQLYLQQLGYYPTPPPSAAPQPQSALSPSAHAHHAAAMNGLQFAHMPGVYYMPHTGAPARSIMPAGIQFGLQLQQFNPYAAAQFSHQQHGLPPTPNLSPISPTYSASLTPTTLANSSVKRSYEHAFRNDGNAGSNAAVAKRQFTGQQAAAAAANSVAAANAAAAVFYSQFYPPPM